MIFLMQAYFVDTSSKRPKEICGTSNSYLLNFWKNIEAQAEQFIGRYRYVIVDREKALAVKQFFYVLLRSENLPKTTNVLMNVF